MNRDSFAGKKVLVMGLGRFGGGLDVAKFAAACGAEVTVTDTAKADKLADSVDRLRQYGGIDLHLGSHDPADFRHADFVVVNPAVPPENQFLRIARQAGAELTSQIEIFFQLCPAPIVGITGANGKSTTAALTAHILAAARPEIPNAPYGRVILSGNIGNRPLLAEIDEIAAKDLVVLELSSFQLEQLARIGKAPKISLLTNLTPNHLDRHGTFAAYCAAKENIFEFQKLDPADPAVSIFNAADPIAAEWFEKYHADKGRICIRFLPEDVPEKMRNAYPLPGRANLENLAAALTVARMMRLADNNIENCLGDFKPLPHRLELVAQINRVCWYNDSIATTPQSAIAALEAFQGPPIIIAGGYDKNISFDEFGRKIAETAKAAILLGQTAPKIAEAIRRAQDSTPPLSARRRPTPKPPHTQIKTVLSLEDAVAQAVRIAKPGDVVLLSPACASYDMFDNFQQRGQLFKKLVTGLSTG
ncbi:MAG: UDP-N-acetylmuramoyl-L-alanine--D-glutamate ligase [Sedimentisphaerales bacterium]|nr:UDP-N-acetylmuramoyl-L-alanine--D-glutamate ligase [Sedimentisphaerales bacterium]